VLATLSRLKRPGPWLVADQLTLADLHAAPVFAYFLKSPEGAAMLASHSELANWWEAVSGLASFTATEPTS
jgi:glutathione S-transferase